jgi:hypothetical protein
MQRVRQTPLREISEPTEGLTMAYIVQADLPGDDAATTTVVTRQEALKTAVGWQKDGHSGVRIIGDGRIYSPEEFALTIIDDQSGT